MNFSILVVEDQEEWLNALIEMYEDVLADIDPHISFVESVAEARRHLRHNEFDLMSLDINLASGNVQGGAESFSGEGDGRTLIRLADEEDSVGGVVCITGIQDDEEIRVVIDGDPTVARIDLPSLLDRRFPNRNAYVHKQEDEPLERQIEGIREVLHRRALIRLSGRHNEFYRKGGSWHVRFKGKEVTVPDRKGMKTIQYLLENEHEGFGVDELFHLETPPDGDTADISKREIDDENLREASQIQKDSSEKKEVVDEIKMVNEKIDELEKEVEDIEEKIRNNLDTDPSRGISSSASDEKLLKELERKKKDLDRAKDTKKELEKELEDSTMKNKRQTVRKRIKRQFQKDDGYIRRAGHEELSDHLRAEISTGYTCSYKPRESPNWITKTR